MHRFEAIYLTFDHEVWLWSWPFTTQNVKPHEILIHSKWQVAILNISKVSIKWSILTLMDNLDLGFSQLKMCNSMRYTCMSHMILLSLIFHKLWQMLKFDANKQSNKPTNQQTGTKQCVPYYSGGGHKNVQIINLQITILK